MTSKQLIQQQLQVIYNYDIVFTHSVFEPSNTTLIDVINRAPFVHKPRMAFVIDEGVAHTNPWIVAAIIGYFNSYTYPVSTSNILIVPGGESIKNEPSGTEPVLELINRNKIDRHSFLVAIGGGALLDAAGYAAAIAHRGVRLIRLPTTVLSQNDSGVGVKNGINYFGKKNFLGTFAPPYAVINDYTFLTTLDNRHWQSGISEAIKVALIKEPSFFHWIEEHVTALNRRDMAAMEQLIYRCAQLHSGHIAKGGDPFEKGSSRPLDFGHWSAHKLEQLTRFNITHGEAVAVGIALDATYSFLSGYLDKETLHSILNCFINLHFEITHPVLTDQLHEILKGVEEFREHLGGQLTVMLLSGIGCGFDIHELDHRLISESVKYLQTFSHSINFPV